MARLRPLNAGCLARTLDHHAVSGQRQRRFEQRRRIQVIADNGAPVEPDMIAWAQHLAPGAWFTLKHGGSSAQVQYVWHSQRRQLHLFVASGGVSYLLQLRRLAAYLQARLLTPQEEESLTLRATREALTQLDAHPERLLG